MNKKEQWLELLFLADKANKFIKAQTLSDFEKNEFYILKDEVLDFIVKNKPDFIHIEFSYIPYYKYSNKSKLGQMLKKDIGYIDYKE